MSERLAMDAGEAGPRPVTGTSGGAAGMAPMKAAVVVQGRVIGALILRETRTRYGKTQLGYLWSLAEPIAVVATFTLIFLALGRPAPIGESLPLFFATGMLAYHIYRRVTAFCTGALEANNALFSFPSVKRLDALLSRALLELLTAVFSLLLIFGFMHAALETPLPAELPQVALACLLLAALGLGHGAINAVIITQFEAWKQIDSIMSRPLFFASAIFFLPDHMPAVVRDVLWWNPVLHGVELMRHGYYADYRGETLSMWFLVSSAFVIMLIGLAAERASRFRSHGDD